ncbi:ribosome biogenesis GTPase RsgA [Acrasis kona]|uniref:Ribosome biogenesis GTPase RsgA n=1 Tax=Acrasis kona TaxID=1008807 RepID=A0AAW2YM67_9EUKA
MRSRRTALREKSIQFLETGVVKKLLILAFVFFVFWQSPDNIDLFSPFTILATYYHETSHGFVALISGFEFSHVSISYDGNGYAEYFIDDVSKKDEKFYVSLISLAGPVGAPILGGSLLIASSHGGKVISTTLAFLGFSIIGCCARWLRKSDVSAYVCMYVLGIFLIYASIKIPTTYKRAVARFLAIQACTCIFTELDYLFSRTMEEFEDKNSDEDPVIKRLLKGRKKGKKQVVDYTDMGEIQHMLGFNYETVAYSVVVFSIAIMAVGLFYVHYRDKRRQTKRQSLVLPQ